MKIMLLNVSVDQNCPNTFQLSLRFHLLFFLCVTSFFRKDRKFQPMQPVPCNNLLLDYPPKSVLILQLRNVACWIPFGKMYLERLWLLCHIPSEEIKGKLKKKYLIYTYPCFIFYIIGLGILEGNTMGKLLTLGFSFVLQMGHP